MLYLLPLHSSNSSTGFRLTGAYGLNWPMTFKTLHTPPYLIDQSQYYQPTRSLSSSGFHQLLKPRHNLYFGSRAFRMSAPHIWNSLPTNIREISSYFQTSSQNVLLSVSLFNPVATRPPTCPDSFKDIDAI